MNDEPKPSPDPQPETPQPSKPSAPDIETYSDDPPETKPAPPVEER
jgi:hypothetical protein